MLADFFTKPLQGSLFCKFRAVLLGEEQTDSLSFVPPASLLEERVENKKDPAVSEYQFTVINDENKDRKIAIVRL